MRKKGIAATLRGKASIVAAMAVLTMAGMAAAPAAAHPVDELGNRPVLFVGNNWAGTADVVRAVNGDYKRIARYNIIPDFDQEMTEVALNPDRLAFFLAIREAVGEGNDQFVDDMFSVGRLLIVARPSFADVIALDLKTREIVWEFSVDGYRSDHMAISPDRKHVAVSASTGNVVHILDTKTGNEVDVFPSGDSPHENNYSENYPRLYHASIGRVYTPTDLPEFDTSKGETVFQIVNSNNYEIIEQIDLRQKFDETGRPNMSTAVRPMAISPKDRFVFFQVSFLHGFVEYNFLKDKVTRVARLPNLVPELPREQYLLDSAHHGLAMNPAGNKLCAAGTMSDYVAVVRRRNFAHKLIFGGEKPYWVTNSASGRYCVVSWSGSDRISIISYAQEKEIDRVAVGDHPQRVRNGTVRLSWLGANP